MKIYLLFCFFILFLGNVYAADYYVCNCLAGADSDCIDGSDSNDGLSPATAWQTFAHTNSEFDNFLAGDSISFCRGGIFQGNSGRWVNYNCQADTRCVIKDYSAGWGSGDEQRPIIQCSNSGINFEDGGNADHDEGYMLMNLEFRGSGSGKGIFLYNDVDYVTIDNVLIDNFEIGIHVAGGNTPNPGSDQTSEHVIIQNSEIYNSGSQGILGGDNDLIIRNNIVAHSGYNCFRAQANVYCHGIYLHVFNGLVENNTVYDSTSQAFSTHNAENLTIRNNYFYTNGYDGHGGGFSLSVSHPDTQEKVVNVTVENNVFHDNELGAYIEENKGLTFRNNLFSNTRSNNFIITSRAYDNENILIEHNTFYNTSGGEFYIGFNTDGLTIRNNIIYRGDGRVYYQADGITVSNILIDGNLIVSSNSEPYRLYPNSYSFTEWQALGYDTNSTFGQDPLFINPGVDFHLMAGSPAIDSGLDSGVDKDLEYLSRPQGAGWDIGAFEFVPTGPDVVPPVRSNAFPSSNLSNGTTQTIISLTTNEMADCKYSTSAGTDYTAMSDVFSTTGSTSHSELITGLVNGNTYNYYVRCNDTSGNYNPDDFMISFGVDLFGDSSGPVISLIGPGDGSNWTSSQTVSFEYSVSDTSDIDNCILIIDGVLDHGSNLIAKDVSQSFSANLGNGVYDWSINCTDSFNNQASSNTLTLNVDYSAPPATPPPSGGGGGGGGSSSGSKSSGLEGSNGEIIIIENIKETVIIESGINGGTATFDFTKDLGIDIVFVLLKNDIDQSLVSVEKLNTKPDILPDIKTSTYAYLEILSDLKDEDITQRTIRFKVPKKWFSQNGILPTEITLNRYTTEWEELPTEKLFADETYQYYKSQTPKLGYLAITSKKLDSNVESEQETEETEPTTVKEEIIKEVEEKKKRTKVIITYYIAMALLIIFLIILIKTILKKRSKNNGFIGLNKLNIENKLNQKPPESSTTKPDTLTDSKENTNIKKSVENQTNNNQ